MQSLAKVPRIMRSVSGRGEQEIITSCLISREMRLNPGTNAAHWCSFHSTNILLRFVAVYAGEHRNTENKVLCHSSFRAGCFILLLHALTDVCYEHLLKVTRTQSAVNKPERLKLRIDLTMINSALIEEREQHLKNVSNQSSYSLIDTVTMKHVHAIYFALTY